MTLKEVAVGQTVKVAKLNGEGPGMTLISPSLLQTILKNY